MAFPDYNQILREVWGWGSESVGILPNLSLASNILVGTNPPYSATDFFFWCPQFGGVPLTPLGTLDGLTELITNVSDVTGLAVGQPVTGTGIADGSLITSVDSSSSLRRMYKTKPRSSGWFRISGVVTGAGGPTTTINITGQSDVAVACDANGNYLADYLLAGDYTITPSNPDPQYSYDPTFANVTISNSDVVQNFVDSGGTGLPSSPSITLSLSTTQAGTFPLTVYVNPVVPLAIINNYIYLASSSILQVRYCELWPRCMALYIAHYLTLWLQGQAAGPGSTPAQIAAAGLAMGIKVAKSVGDVSTSSKPLDAFDDWGTYALTLYGQQLATYAMALGSGPVLLW